jgi:phage major head subunit gpT-like protein
MKFRNFVKVFVAVLAVFALSEPLFAREGLTGYKIAIAGVVTADSLIALQKSFKAIFNEAIEAATPDWPNIAIDAPSEGAEENYQWLLDLPQMREWLGDKIFKELRGYQYTIRNRDWEASLEVDRNDIEDDRLGIYRPRILQLANVAAGHPDILLTEVRESGTSNLCYDGKNFYAANHKAGESGTLSNLLSGTGVTLDKIMADFISARATLRKYKTDQGNPFIREKGKLKFRATIPPDLEGVFELLIKSDIISNTTNVLKGAFEYAVDSGLTDDADWYLDYIGSPIKPFVVQTRKKPTFVAVEDPTAASVFLRRKFQYSSEARFNVGYGFWQYSIKIHNA